MAMDQREANLFFQMVNHYYERSIGLGGGTVVRLDEDGEFTIGPDSVGHRLYEKGLLFGGDTLTTTDVVVALGKANLGHVEQLKHLDKVLLQRVYDKMVEMVEETIDKMKKCRASTGNSSWRWKYFIANRIKRGFRVS